MLSDSPILAIPDIRLIVCSHFLAPSNLAAIFKPTQRKPGLAPYAAKLIQIRDKCCAIAWNDLGMEDGLYYLFLMKMPLLHFL
jgi:hypothetical protein